MPINVNDPRYRAEIVPESIAAMGPRLCAAYGVGADAFGAKGNEYHDYGFHRSENWIYLSGDSRYGTSDYSVQGSVNHAPNKDWIAAFDFTPGVWGTSENRRRMIEITTRVVAALKRRDPRVAEFYEFAGTLDGAHVITVDSNGNPRSPFDLSHLDHCHGSIKRSLAGNNHQGIVDVVLGVDEHDEQEEDGMPYANITVPGRGEVASVSVPGGGANKAQLYVCATNDTGDLDGIAHEYALRIFYSDGKTWAAAGGGNGLFKGGNGKTLSIALPNLVTIPDGVRGVSVMRAPIGAAGVPVDPKEALKAEAQPPTSGGGGATPIPPIWYDGPLTFCIETQRP